MAPLKRPGMSTSDYGLYSDKIRDDLTKELPQWILSAYGPGRAAVVPRQLFGGLPRELSFEELRLRQYELAASGNQQQALQVERDLFREADEQNKKALQQLDGAISYIMDGANEHPNRIDIANSDTAGKRGEGQGQQVSNPFNSANISHSAQGQNTTPLGRPAAFPTNGPLTAPNVPMNTPATPIFSSNPFSKGNTSMSFGQVPPNQPSNGFAKPSPPLAALDPFGRPVQPTTIFGQPAQPTATSNPFSAPTRSAATSTPFQSHQHTNPFNPASQQVTGPGLISKFKPSTATPSGGPILNSTGTSKLPASSDTIPPDQKLRSWKGKSVIYEDEEPYIKLSEGQLARIWFLHGPPEFANDEGVGKEDDLALKERYCKAEEMGTFGEGQVPEVAPRMEWVSWDL